ncbi:hypothetical protein [Paenibacillus apii]|uniref:hypothetical protein n=1 Tax=Paenibacillus apii TaxID=1850370 RepID=UPI0014391144|nr:hypothetical protein [Paenibacillus apii]NJJ37832.1 hypothetical protein [Paenibacillus apii]
MSRFSLKGTIDGIEVEVTWADGRLLTTPSITALILSQAAALEASGELIGPVGGPYRERDYLNDPLAALFLLREHVFDTVVDATGDVPSAPTVPWDGIA